MYCPEFIIRDILRVVGVWRQDADLSVPTEVRRLLLDAVLRLVARALATGPGYPHDWAESVEQHGAFEPVPAELSREARRLVCYALNYDGFEEIPESTREPFLIDERRIRAIYRRWLASLGFMLCQLRDLLPPDCRNDQPLQTPPVLPPWAIIMPADGLTEAPVQVTSFSGDGVTITPGPDGCYHVQFTQPEPAPTPAPEYRLIRMIVAGYFSPTEPVFFVCKLQLPVHVILDDEHYTIAQHAAETEGFNPPFVVFDEMDAHEEFLAIFEWDRAPAYDEHGEYVVIATDDTQVAHRDSGETALPATTPRFRRLFHNPPVGCTDETSPTSTQESI